QSGNCLKRVLDSHAQWQEMSQIAAQHRESMNLCGCCNSNIFKARSVCPRFIENPAGPVRASQVERQNPVRIEMLYGSPPVSKSLRLCSRALPISLGNPRHDLSTRNH